MRAWGAALGLALAACGGDAGLAELARTWSLDTQELVHEEWLRTVRKRERELAALPLTERRERLARWREEIAERVAAIELRLELRADATFVVRYVNGGYAGEQRGTWSRDGDRLRFRTERSGGDTPPGGWLAEGRVTDGALRLEGEGVPTPFVLR